MGVLTGFTVAVAADRRRHELAGLLEGAGARTVGVQAVRPVAQPDTEAVAEATRACVAQPVHEVVVSSAFGLRAWLQVARGLDLLDPLVARLAQARLLARDARAADGLRELGLTQIWSTAAATTEDLFRYLLAQPMAGRRVVAQIDAEPHRELSHTLGSRGADVVEVVTTRAQPPPHMDVLRRLGELIQRRHVDAVALTSAATTEYLLSQAEADGVLDEVVHALATDVAAVCLGPLTARPLRDHGVPAIVAATPTILDLAAVVASDLPARAVVLRVGGHSVEVRSQAVVVGGQVVALAPGPIAVLRALALSPGRVLSAAEIRHVWKTGSRVDDHAVEMAVSRLRKCLDGTALEGVELVQTVMKRGYRVAG